MFLMNLNLAFFIQKEDVDRKRMKEEESDICKEKEKKDLPFTSSGAINVLVSYNWFDFLRHFKRQNL